MLFETEIILFVILTIFDGLFFQENNTNLQNIDKEKLNKIGTQICYIYDIKGKKLRLEELFKKEITMTFVSNKEY